MAVKRMTDSSVMSILDKALPEGALENDTDFHPDNSDLTLQTPPSTADTPPTPPDAPPAPEPKPDAPPVPEAPPAVPPTAPPPATDIWADAEEFEVEDTDFGKKFKVKVPKTDAEWAKKGYSMHSDYTRKTQSLAKHRDTLDRLAKSGDLDTAVAVWDRGQNDPAFRNAVIELYYQAASGRPLSYGQPQYQPAETPPTQYQPTEEDPLGIGPVIDARMAKLSGTVETLAQQQARQALMGEFNTRVNAARGQASAQTYTEFAQRFPTEFTGDAARDAARMNQVWNYAENSGLVHRLGAQVNQDRYNQLLQIDPNQALSYVLDCASRLPYVMYTAKLEMDRAAYAAASAPAPPSAAMSAADAAAAAERASRDALARTIASGNATTPPVQPPPKPKVELRDKRGRSRPALDILTDALGWNESTRTA